MLCHNEFVDGGAMIAVQQRLQFRTLAAMSSGCGATRTGTRSRTPPRGTDGLRVETFPYELNLNSTTFVAD